MRKLKSLGGFYLPGRDRAVISVAPTEGSESARQLIFHEYVHHLFRSAEQEPYAWFNEGMAELLAGFRVEGNELQIGHPLLGRLRALQTEKLLSLETLFVMTPQTANSRSDDHTGLFYAESWALLHYWLFGESGLPAEGVKRFVEVAEDPSKINVPNMRAFFRDCFGMDYPEMEKRLDRYVHSGSYRWGRQPLPTLEPKNSYTKEPLSRDEARLALADLGVRVNDSPSARLVLFKAMEDAPASPRPFETIGAAAARNGDEDSMIDYWEKAAAAGTSNVAIYRELALAECRKYFRKFDYDLRLPPEESSRLRTRLKLSIDHEPLQIAAYEMLAWVEAFAADRSIPNVNLVQGHFHDLKDKARTLVALAMVRVRAGQPQDALKMLKQLPTLERDHWAAQAAEVITARIEDRPVQMLADTRAGVETQERTGSEMRNITRLPSVPLPEDL
jgi:hypothetical protein